MFGVVKFGVRLLTGISVAAALSLAFPAIRETGELHCWQVKTWVANREPIAQSICRLKIKLESLDGIVAQRTRELAKAKAAFASAHSQLDQATKSSPAG